MTGIDDPYEEPTAPALNVGPEVATEVAVERILALLPARANG